MLRLREHGKSVGMETYVIFSSFGRTALHSNRMLLPLTDPNCESVVYVPEALVKTEKLKVMKLDYNICHNVKELSTM